MSSPTSIASTAHPGRSRSRLFIEACVNPNANDGSVPFHVVSATLETIFSERVVTVTLGVEMLENDIYGDIFPEYLLSLKAVEYMGKPNGTILFVQDTKIVVNTYQEAVQDMAEDDDQSNLVEDMELLPSKKYAGIWDGLFFDSNIKEELLGFIINTINFDIRNYEGTGYKSKINRLILLSGTPGTGQSTLLGFGSSFSYILAHSFLHLFLLLFAVLPKTTAGKSSLCLGLANKLSIRLNKHYPSLNFHHLCTSTLLSKFFGESSQRIKLLFDSLLADSRSSPKTFSIVLIDEIDSLAASRSSASERGEVGDAVRAANALLTGLDTILGIPNVLVLCTSNLTDTLDEAFLDRCGKHVVIPPPSACAMYEILKHELAILWRVGIISDWEDDLSNYFEAAREQMGAPSYQLRKIVDKLTGKEAKHLNISARWLGRLPQEAMCSEMHDSDSITLMEAVANLLSHVGKMIISASSATENGTVVSRRGDSPPGKNNRRLLEDVVNRHGNRSRVDDFLNLLKEA